MYQIGGILLGGAIGALLRFMVANGVYQWLGRGFPYGTLVVNVFGSFFIGFLTLYFMERELLTSVLAREIPAVRPALGSRPARAWSARRAAASSWAWADCQAES